MIKNWKFRLIFHDFVDLFDTFVRLFVGLWQSRTIFSQWKKSNHVSIYASRVGSWEKIIQRLQIDCDHIQCCRTCSKSIGPFLVRTASQSQRGGSIINMKGTERDLRGIDPRLVSIIEIESSKGNDHEKSWHQVWKKEIFLPSKTEEKTRFLEKDLQICEFLMC